jgi:hypothetical protein
MWAEDGSVVNPEMMAAPVFGGTVRVKKGTQRSPDASRHSRSSATRP